MKGSTVVRALAMALPGAEEVPHFGSPSFRRGGRIFIQINESTNEGIFKLSAVHQEMLFEKLPETFKPEIWGRIRWARVTLADVPYGELKMLVREAYDQVARVKSSRRGK
jgi:hypothetical protein